MAAPTEPGTVLSGKFRVDHVLGQGGMGVVVAAHHLHLDEQVAIKFLLPNALTDSKVVARFAQEARAAVKIKSEHVARVIDVGTLENGAPFIVMERLVGSDLGDLILRHGKLTVEDAVDYVLQASEAVAEAHALGIVHRDLKPSNLFLTRRADGSPCVKVLDFGISKVLPPPGALPGAEQEPGAYAGLTHSSVVMGSPNYMSPEQLASTRDVDTRTDVYALGAILYHLLAGRPPFVAESFAELCSLVLNTTPQPLRPLNPLVPEGLEKAVLLALQKHLKKRTPTVAALAQQIVPFGPPHARVSAERIGRVLHAPVTGAPSAATLPPPAPEDATMDGLGHTVTSKRNSALWAALAATLLGGGAIAITLLRGGADPAPATSESGHAGAAPPPTAVTPSAAPAVTADTPATAAPTTAAPEPVVTPSPGPTGSAAPLVVPQPETTASAPKRAPVTPPKPAPKRNCEPAYYFDSDGTKHFKPECF